MLRYWYSRPFNRGQAYFWTKEWQEGERQAEADIAAGNVVTFRSTDELMAWLTSTSASDPHAR